MSTDLSLTQETIASSTSDSDFSPTKILINLAILIFLAETAAMAILFFVDSPSYVVTTLLDGIIMLVLILPGLYWFQLNPLVKQMEERAQAESALRANEELLRSVLELLPVGVWILDSNGNIVHGNPASQEIWNGVRYLGIERYGEYKGWWADTGQPIQPEEWSGAKAITLGETSLNEEIEIESFDGVRKIIMNSAVPILDEQRVIQGAVVVNQDITARRQTQRALMQSNELLERFFSSIGVLIAYMDRDFNFIRVNEAYAESAGHDPDFFLGKNHFDLYPHSENETIFRRVVETGEPFYVTNKPFEYAEFPQRGVSIWDWSLQPVKGADGDIQGVVLSLMDVTDRIRAESLLTHQNQELLMLTEAEHKQRELAESLVQSVIKLSSSLQPGEVLTIVLDQIQRSVPFRSADIVLIEDDHLTVAAFRGPVGYPESIAAFQREYTLDEFPLLQQIRATHKPVLINDTSQDANWRFAPEMEWVRSYLGAPLIHNGQVTGFVNLTGDTPGFFSREALERLMAFAAPAALALNNAQLYKAESDARQAAETLRAAAQSLTQTLDLDQIINSLLGHIDSILHADVTGIALLEGETHFAVRALTGDERWIDTEQALSLVLDAELSPLLQQLLSTRKSVLLPDITTLAEWQRLPGVEAIRCWLGVPLVAGDRVIGVVGLGKVEEGSFAAEKIQWAEILVGQAAMAVQNAWLFDQVRSSSERLQSLAHKLVELQESERYHIARELHDETGQVLSSLKLSLGRLEQDPDCPPHIRQRLLELKSATDSVLEELHRLAMDLRPVALDHLGLVAALEQLAGRSSSGRLSVQFKAVGFNGDRLPQDLETSLYRIVQESLTNVMRHADASDVGILLERIGGRVKLFVEDDGVGFESNRSEEGERLGLVGMRERAEMFGGTLTIESSPGIGTSIIVEVPDVDSNSHR